MSIWAVVSILAIMNIILISIIIITRSGFNKRINNLEQYIEELNSKFDSLDRYVTWKTKGIGISWSKKIYNFLVSLEYQIVYKIKTYLDK
jgi:predicted PurR-regulated permease PerM